MMQFKSSLDLLPIINTDAHANNALAAEQYEQKSEFYVLTNHSNKQPSVQRSDIIVSKKLWHIIRTQVAFKSHCEVHDFLSQDKTQIQWHEYFYVTK